MRKLVPLLATMSQDDRNLILFLAGRVSKKRGRAKAGRKSASSAAAWTFERDAILVLDGHCVRVNGFLARNTFESGNYTAIVVFVALHRKAAFSFTSGPRQANVVLL